MLIVIDGLLLTGCSKDASSWWGPASREVEATLPALAVADAVLVEPMGSRALAVGDAVGTSGASDDNGGLFTVSLGPDEGMRSSADYPATRSDVALSNVWVLQFDASGATKSCVYVGTVASGAKVKAALQSGDGYTIWIVANGPASGGFTPSTPATLTDFENKLLYRSSPASDGLIPLSGKLTGVKVLSNGQVLVGSDNTVVPQITLSRALARVDVLLEYSVDGAELDGVWLYQVPVGASYGLAPSATGFPSSGEASNFSYRDGQSEGLSPVSSGSGTVTHTWYIGDNRRGQVPTIQWEKNKGGNNAPAQATYARIKSHESSNANKGLFHDVYLGENVTTDFDVKRNRHYIYRVRIGGMLDQQKVLAGRDDRVWAGTFEYLEGAPTVTPSLGSTIALSGQTFKVTFRGYWSGSGIPVQAMVGDTQLAAGTAAWQEGNTGEATLDIPKNEGGERRIEFFYQWKGVWNAIGAGTQAAGYTVTKATHNAPATIPGQGGTYSVTLEGFFPAGGVTVHAATGNTVLAEGTVTTSGQAVQLKVPANMSYNGRPIKFTYNWQGAWPVIGTERTQRGWTVDEATHDAPATISAGGGTYTVTLKGWLGGDYSVRAVTDNDAVLAGPTATTTNEQQVEQTTTLTIPAYDGETNRTIRFQYKTNGTWVTIPDPVEQSSEVKGPSLTYAACKERCATMGGIPTYDIAVYMDWSEWGNAGTERTFWSNSWYIGTDESSGMNIPIILKDNVISKNHWQPTWTGEKSCRCVNEN